MASPGTSPLRFREHRQHTFYMLGLLLLAGCTGGDFGRIRPSLVTADTHSWIGTQAAASAGLPASGYGLTDDERELRDLAYPLIEPPFDRNRWYSILGEYGAARAFPGGFPEFDHTAYGRELMARHYRSPTARYAQLNQDVRNDLTRIGPFLRTAARIADMDKKREQSLAYIPSLNEEERAHALNRVAENQLIVEWVRHSLNERAAGYRFALERLVISYPSPMAVDAERSLNLLRRQIGENQRVAAKLPARK